MNQDTFRASRRKHGWTQQQAALRLGVSQSYVSMLESGQRRPGPGFAARSVSVLGLPAVELPLRPFPSGPAGPQALVEWLAALGYPGFLHYRSRRRAVNPAELLLSALTQEELEPRLAEALPWLVMRYPGMDADWLARNAKLYDAQNRLGFVVTLARRVDERLEGPDTPRVRAQSSLESRLEPCRLAREDTLCQASLNEVERRWLRENRGEEARHWNLLVAWRPDSLRYVA